MSDQKSELQYWTKPNKRSPWREVTEEEAKRYFLTSCATNYVRVTTDAYPHKAIAIGRIIEAKTRVVVDLKLYNDIDPLDDDNYTFDVPTNNWDAVLEEALPHFDRPGRGGEVRPPLFQHRP